MSEDIEVLKHKAVHKGELCFEGLYIDKRKRIVVRKKNEIDLTYTEFEILLLLAQNAGIVFSKEQIYDRVWKEPYYGDYNIVMSHAPLSVLVLNIGQQNDRGLNFAKSDDRLNEILMSLDGAVVDNQKMIFIRRNLRIYQPNRIFIIKPSQRKYWTYSAACRDADEIFEDISRAWR